MANWHQNSFWQADGISPNINLSPNHTIVGASGASNTTISNITSAGTTANNYTSAINAFHGISSISSILANGGHHDISAITNTAERDHLSRVLDNSTNFYAHDNVRGIVRGIPLGRTNPSRFSQPSLPNHANNESFVAAVDRTPSQPCHTALNNSSPSLLPPVSKLLHNSLLAPNQPLPSPTTPAPTAYWEQFPNQHPLYTPSRQPASSFGSSFGSLILNDPLRSHPVRSAPSIQRSSQFFHGFGTPTSSVFSTTSTAPSSTPMNSATPRSDPRATPPLPDLPLRHITETARISDEHFLTTLATQDFTSPSLPPLSSPGLPSSPSAPGQPNIAVPAISHQEMQSSGSRRRTLNRARATEVAKQEPITETTISGVDPSIPPATMPSSTRTRSFTSTADSASRKRQNPPVTSPSSRPSKARRKLSPTADELPSPFDDDQLEKQINDTETVNLTDATEVPAELKAPEIDKRVKIGKFQCVICMDDTSALTVTHCGHLFCSECLHSSLHIDTMKRTCPVCRTKVDLKDKKGKTSKSFYHLELKLMTEKQQGKRRAGGWTK